MNYLEISLEIIGVDSNGEKVRVKGTFTPPIARENLSKEELLSAFAGYLDTFEKFVNDRISN